MLLQMVNEDAEEFLFRLFDAERNEVCAHVCPSLRGYAQDWRIERCRRGWWRASGVLIKEGEGVLDNLEREASFDKAKQANSDPVACSDASGAFGGAHCNWLRWEE